VSRSLIIHTHIATPTGKTLFINRKSIRAPKDDESQFDSNVIIEDSTFRKCRHWWRGR